MSVLGKIEISSEVSCEVMSEVIREVIRRRLSVSGVGSGVEGGAGLCDESCCIAAALRRYPSNCTDISFI